MMQAICEECDLWFWPGSDDYENVIDTGVCLFCEMGGCKQEAD